MVEKLLTEGSLISLGICLAHVSLHFYLSLTVLALAQGRSEPLLLNRRTLSKFPTTALPHVGVALHSQSHSLTSRPVAQGRVFGVVGVEEISRHKYVVLRDGWGLQRVRSEGIAVPFAVS